MDGEFKEKYEKYKLIVKLWENDFKKTQNRIPSKVSVVKKYIFKKLNYTQLKLPVRHQRCIN